MLLPYIHTLRAESFLEAGHIERGLEAVEEADSTEIVFYRAETLRVKGGLLAQCQGELDSAVACIASALDLARAQKANSLELRAALSLALLAEQEKRAGGLKDLTAILGRFPESIDERDLVEARHLVSGVS